MGCRENRGLWVCSLHIPRLLYVAHMAFFQPWYRMTARGAGGWFWSHAPLLEGGHGPLFFAGPFALQSVMVLPHSFFLFSHCLSV